MTHISQRPQPPAVEQGAPGSAPDVAHSSETANAMASAMVVLMPTDAAPTQGNGKVEHSTRVVHTERVQ